jgi:hypothetical protein
MRKRTTINFEVARRYVGPPVQSTGAGLWHSRDDEGRSLLRHPDDVTGAVGRNIKLLDGPALHAMIKREAVAQRDAAPV